jgi:BSD domain
VRESVYCVSSVVCRLSSVVCRLSSCRLSFALYRRSSISIAVTLPNSPCCTPGCFMIQIRQEEEKLRQHRQNESQQKQQCTCPFKHTYPPSHPLIHSPTHPARRLPSFSLIVLYIVKHAYPVWRIEAEDKSILSDELQKRVIELSANESNLLLPPHTEETLPVVDYRAWLPFAVICLKHDPRLNQVRFKLVPKSISEADFWSNYFHRVMLMRKSMGVEPLELPEPVQDEDEEDDDDGDEDEDEKCKTSMGNVDTADSPATPMRNKSSTYSSPIASPLVSSTAAGAGSPTSNHMIVNGAAESAHVNHFDQADFGSALDALDNGDEDEVDLLHGGDDDLADFISSDYVNSHMQDCKLNSG